MRHSHFHPIKENSFPNQTMAMNEIDCAPSDGLHRSAAPCVGERLLDLLPVTESLVAKDDKTLATHFSLMALPFELILEV